MPDGSGWSRTGTSFVVGIDLKPDGLNNDLHARPEYRARLVSVMAKRAVQAALG